MACEACPQPDGASDSWWLFDTSGFPPRWQCGTWPAALGWLHIAGDLGIWSAYMAIPCAIAIFLARRRLPLPGIAWLFIAFIASCGIGHLLEAVTFWLPLYRFTGAWKAITALLSWATALVIIWIMPRILRGPSMKEIGLSLNEEMRERLRIQENLREVNTQLAKVHSDLHFRSMAIDEHAIVATTDPKGRITFVNDRFCAISGYSRDELLGRDHRMINSGHHPKEFFRDMFRTIASGRVWRGEIKNRAKDGSFYWVKSTIVPFVGPGGKMREYIAIRDDITPLKVTEEQLKETVQKLEVSSIELDRRNCELEQFVYTVSHDLKTPLVTILGFATHVVKDLDAGDRLGVVDATERIIKAAKKLKSHIDELLEFGRIGRVAQEPAPVDLDQATDETLEEFKLQLDELKLTPVRKFGVKTILADRARLMQVLQNLVSNALRYGCPGPGAQLEIGSIAHENEVRLYVRDFGPGLAAEHHERIFGLFQHLGTRPDCSGVGLAHVRRIAQVHGGHAWVVSAPGQGATFWVSFAASAARQLQSRPIQKAKAA